VKQTGIETNPTAIAAAVGTILSVSPIEDDHNCLERIFSQLRWTLHKALTLSYAIAFLAENHAPVVICECDLAPGTWKDLLDWAMVLPQPPCVIVTSRLADDYLWAEALNVGAYDVLAKPFERAEVIRIVSLASRSWHDRCSRSSASKIRALHAA